MEALCNEIKSSAASVKPQCKLNPSKLQAVNINVNGFTAALEKCKEFRKAENKVRRFDEFKEENAKFRNDARLFSERIQHSIDTAVEFQAKETVNVFHIAEDVFKVQMNIDARKVYFQVRCDCETNRFLGLESEPPIENIREIEKLPYFEEIISMMAAGFRLHFEGSVIK